MAPRWHQGTIAQYKKKNPKITKITKINKFLNYAIFRNFPKGRKYFGIFGLFCIINSYFEYRIRIRLYMGTWLKYYFCDFVRFSRKLQKCPSSVTNFRTKDVFEIFGDF